MKYSNLLSRSMLLLGCSQWMMGCLAGNNQEFFQHEVNSLESLGNTPVVPVDGGSSQPVATPTPVTQTPNSDICVTNPTAAACNETPVVATPGVVTILFTMSQIPQNSGSLILANAIKYASPETNPRILFVKDYDTAGEDEGDPAYIQNTLLAGYDVDYAVIPSTGLSPAMVANYDLVIVSNPGYPLSNIASLNTLNGFSGGVILIGDDLAHGAGFSMDAFTGLHYADNGTSMTCGGHTYGYDNLQGYFYQIAMNSEFLPGIPAQYMNYQYGNDLDWTTADANTQVLAWGSAAPGTCDIGLVPAVVRHER